MAKNEVRIISGKWKGRKLRFADRPNLRPTLGRARETLFNWLAADISSARCLDLFAGSGALGFEAASRGAEHVTFVEPDRAAAKALKANIALLDASSLSVATTDAKRFLREADDRWDIVFLDPPFDTPLLDEALALLPAHLAPQALVYWESRVPLEPPEGFERAKNNRAGDAHFGLLRWDGS